MIKHRKMDVLRDLIASGDKVMQTRNNYEKGIYNGDIGFIQAIAGIGQSILVDFDPAMPGQAGAPLPTIGAKPTS